MFPSAQSAVMPDQSPSFVLPRRYARLKDVASRRMHDLVVILDNLQDPHNASAVLRSCDAFGVQNVYVIERSREFSVSRGVSQGCDRWLTIHRVDEPDVTLRDLKAQGFRILLADPEASATPLYEQDFAGKVALVFGNETSGAAGETRAYCDGRFVVPMVGFSQSLNVSVAAAVSISFAVERRRSWLGGEQTDAPRRSEDLLQAWVTREIAARKPPRGSAQEHVT